MTTPRQPQASSRGQLRTKDNLIIALARLKRAAPASFQEFEKHFIAWYGDVVMRCVQSPSNEIFSNQGRAQLAGELLEWLQTCVATADELEAKMKERK